MSRVRTFRCAPPLAATKTVASIRQRRYLSTVKVKQSPIQLQLLSRPLSLFFRILKVRLNLVLNRRSQPEDWNRKFESRKRLILQGSPWVLQISTTPSGNAFLRPLPCKCAAASCLHISVAPTMMRKTPMLTTMIPPHRAYPPHHRISLTDPLVLCHEARAT